ncbi:MAG: hypothetical protein JXB07_18815 [Anaerolineae bacterium]|nr:hypothetical protein [Anaerolineae bacterium]
MTELSERLKIEIENGTSARAIGRKAGMSDNTVRRALSGQSLDHATIEKFAAYLHLPVDEVYRMAGILPPMYTDGKVNRTWLLSKLWDVLSRLPEEDQALILSEAIRLSNKHQSSDDAS